MSALFNQTNITPGTAFAASGGGGSNFPGGLTADAIGMPNFSGVNLQPDNSLAAGQTILRNANGGFTAATPAQAGSFTCYEPGFIRVFDPSQVQGQIINWNFANVVTTGGAFVNLKAVSTIQASNYTANAVALMSSLQATFPSNFM